MTSLPVRVHVDQNSHEIIAEMPDGSLQKIPRHVNQDLTMSCYNQSNATQTTGE